MKKAMIDMDSAIADSGSKMLLQVHDELIFEVLEKEVDKFSSLVTKVMEKTWKLSVPLKVSLSSADNWGELH